MRIMLVFEKKMMGPIQGQDREKAVLGICIVIMR
jgi:hypothetical protein